MSADVAQARDVLSRTAAAFPAVKEV